MSEQNTNSTPWHDALQQAVDRRDVLLSEQQRVIDDLAEALSMIASEETTDPVRFAAQALANDGLYTE